jgi:nucleotide-binding universal stress UspA family protein
MIVLGSVAEAVLRDSGLPIILTRYDEAGGQG